MQASLAQDGPSDVAPNELAWPDAVAFLCGMKAMVEAARETLAKLGIPKERTHLNY